MTLEQFYEAFRLVAKRFHPYRTLRVKRAFGNPHCPSPMSAA